MKRLLSLLCCLAAAALLLVGTGCERHPLDQTTASQPEKSSDGKASGH